MKRRNATIYPNCGLWPIECCFWWYFRQNVFVHENQDHIMNSICTGELDRWTCCALQPLICSVDSENSWIIDLAAGSRARTETMLRAAIFSAMIALGAGTVVGKTNEHWLVWPPTADKNMCNLRSFGQSQRQRTMDNELHVEVRHPMDDPSNH